MSLTDVNQSIAGAALAYLTTRPRSKNAEDIPSDFSAVENSPATIIQHAQADAISAQQPQLALPTQPTAHPLPSLLGYIDHELMKSSSRHNHPPHPNAICCICFEQWDTPIQIFTAPNPLEDTPVITSTFLPLSPCDHWVHYRCQIWIATRNNANNANCNLCKTPLFHWEGITALTLATRTGLEMEDGSEAVMKRVGSNVVQQSDKADYEAECAVIESLIHARFFAHLALPSMFEDNSPDLVQCLADVLCALARLERPKARWLKFSTRTGYVLYTMLVLLKMRRYMLSRHSMIAMTEGWRRFEGERLVLQQGILVEVHKEGG